MNILLLWVGKKSIQYIEWFHGISEHLNKFKAEYGSLFLTNKGLSCNWGAVKVSGNLIVCQLCSFGHDQDGEFSWQFVLTQVIFANRQVDLHHICPISLWKEPSSGETFACQTTSRAIAWNLFGYSIKWIDVLGKIMNVRRLKGIFPFKCHFDCHTEKGFSPLTNM